MTDKKEGERKGKEKGRTVKIRCIANANSCVCYCTKLNTDQYRILNAISADCDIVSWSLVINKVSHWYWRLSF